MSNYLPRLSQVKNWLCDTFRHSSQWAVLGRSWTLDIKPLDVTEISRVSGGARFSLRLGMWISNILPYNHFKKYICIWLFNLMYKNLYSDFIFMQSSVLVVFLQLLFVGKYIYEYIIKLTYPLSGKSGNSSLSFKAIGFGWTNPPNSEPLDEISISSDRELS